MYNYETMDKRLVVFGSLFAIANRLQTEMDRRIEGISAKQWYIVMMLGMFDSPPTLKQLAKISDTSHQNVKQIVVKLEQKGYVRLEKDPEDLRAMRIIATEKCNDWGEKNEKTAKLFIDRMFDRFTPEEITEMSRQLLALYDQLALMRDEEP